MRRKRQTIGPLFAVCILAAFAATHAGAGTITVCSGGCDSSSIQGAVNVANSGDIIEVLATVHTEADIVVNESVEIRGAAGLDTTLQAAAAPDTGAGRVFAVLAGTTVVMRDLIIRHGSTEDNGAGILNLGHLTLDSVKIEFNRDSTGLAWGGGISNEGGTLILLDSQLWHNYAGWGGGGLYSDASSTLMAEGCSLWNNEADGSGGNLYTKGVTSLTRCSVASGDANSGGGIFNRGSLTMVENDLAYNDAYSGAGLQQEEGSTILLGGMFRENIANHGGGILVGGGTLSVSNATFEDNGSGDEGGAVSIQSGQAIFIGTTMVGNHADGSGGAVYTESSTTARLVNSTLSGNTAYGSGGAILVADTRRVSLSSSTVVFNTADSDFNGTGSGGGIAFGSGCTGACGIPRANIENTLIANNVDGSPAGGLHGHDCVGELTSEGFNLVEKAGTSAIHGCWVAGDESGMIRGVDPQLEALADNGGAPVVPPWFGPPQTHALASASLAVDAGDPAGCFDDGGVLLERDQRGALRSGRCDIGAFEYGGIGPWVVFGDGFETGDTSAWSN